MLGTVDLGLTWFLPGGPGPANVFLYGDAMGSPDNGNQTFLGSVVPTAESGTTNNSILSFSVLGNVNVTMGTNYWLVLKPVNNIEEDFWQLSALGNVGPVAVTGNDSDWNVNPDFYAAGVSDHDEDERCSGRRVDRLALGDSAARPFRYPLQAEVS